MSQRTSRPYRPFQQDQNPTTPYVRVDDLEENIQTMGAQGPQDYTGQPTPIRVEEQYEINERHAMSTSTTPTYYDIVTTGPKEILVVADGADHYVDFNQQISSDSPKVFNGGSISITSKGVTRVWAQTVSAANSTLRITVFKR
jgi:hypothetical protein